MTRQALTLFSGLGGSAYALQNIVGADVTATVEYLPAAARSLRANGFHVIEADVRDVDYKRQVGEADIIVGGPPCQPFSQGGRNAGQADERDMVPEFVRAVAELLPEVFVLENVRGLAGPRHRDYLALRVSELEALGYAVDYRVLDAADFSVPQSRKRLFVVGVRADLGRAVRWPVAGERIVPMANALAWSEKEAWQRNQQAPVDARVAIVDSRWRWVFERPSTTVVGSFRPDVQAAPGYRRAGDGPRQNAPGSVVTTPEERLALFGLPREWKVEGSKSQRDLQIGNTVPPAVLAAVVSVNLTAHSLEEEVSA